MKEIFTQEIFTSSLLGWVKPEVNWMCDGQESIKNVLEPICVFNGNRYCAAFDSDVAEYQPVSAYSLPTEPSRGALVIIAKHGGPK